jgi:hypothetical protein
MIECTSKLWRKIVAWAEVQHNSHDILNKELYYMCKACILRVSPMPTTNILLML